MKEESVTTDAVAPEEQADDRIVQCVIWDPEGQVTGTLADAAR